MPVETFGPGDGDLAEMLVDRVVDWSGLEAPRDISDHKR